MEESLRDFTTTVTMENAINSSTVAVVGMPITLLLKKNAINFVHEGMMLF